MYLASNGVIEQVPGGFCPESMMWDGRSVGSTKNSQVAGMGKRGAVIKGRRTSSGQLFRWMTEFLRQENVCSLSDTKSWTRLVLGNIELLGDEFHHALLGAVFENDGTPVPCYSSGMVVEQFMSEGLTEDQAVEYVNEVTEGMGSKILWIHPGATAGVLTRQQTAPATGALMGFGGKIKRNIAGQASQRLRQEGDGIR